MTKSKIPLGDARLSRPFNKLINAMAEKLTVIVRQLGPMRKDEVSFGRLINNVKVTPDSLVNQYWAENQTDWSGKHLLVVEDGSALSFKLGKNRHDLGRVGESKSVGGFYIHNAILLDASDLSCAGLGAAQAYKTDHRSEEEKAWHKKNNWKIPFSDKESYKWYSTAKSAIGNCPGAASYTIVGDRESDIYDVLGRFHQHGWGFVLRCSADRRVVGEADTSKLYQTLDSWEVAHTYSLDLRATKKRSNHKAELEMKFGSVNLLRPTWHPDKSLPEFICVQVVEVKEHPSTVVPGEEAVHWILLTSHEVNSIEQALCIVKWYGGRWNVEQTYRTIKLEGLDVEHSEAENYHALANLAVLALLAATQVMTLVRARDGQTEQTMDNQFSPQEIECIQKLSPTLEGDTPKQKNPHPVGSMAFAAWVVARLGGWSGYASHRPPGPITMLNGLVRFYAIFQGFVLKL